MALLAEIIKKYEVQAQQRLAETREYLGNNGEGDEVTVTQNGNPQSLGYSSSSLLSTPSNEQLLGKPAPTLTEGKEITMQDQAHFNWHNQLVEFYKHVQKANMILQEMESSASVLKELQRIRDENIELKEKLKQLES